MTMTVMTAPRTGFRAAENLDQLDDFGLLRVMRSLPRDSERHAEACGILVGRYKKLVRSCVRRYSDSPEPVEDLMQVGYVGLLKAINNFNPDFGNNLSAYAAPCISGEIKRHFRDKRWQIHVRRAAQELLLEVRTATELLTHRLGRNPLDSELAEHLGVTESELLEARRADVMFHVYSLDAPLSDKPDSTGLADLLGDEDPGVQHTVDMEAVTAHWQELPDREQHILLLRFYGNLTQAEIGERLGISQMHVSRLLARALSHLRERLDGHEENVATALPAAAQTTVKGRR
jgi:RNA polymerase sigma-B factor